MTNGIGFPQLPAAPNPPASIESAIGTALAEAAAELGQALAEYRGAGLTNGARAQAGDAIAWLHTLQQESAGLVDFHATVRREGRIALTRRLASVGATADEAALDAIVSDVLTLVGEAAFAN